MKLQIKTLNQKSLVIDIEETKTVYELKKKLSLYPDIGVKPEFQKIIYAGKLLVNEEKLSTYNIDVKKFLVIMTMKYPFEVPAKVTEAKEMEKKSSKVATAIKNVPAIAPESHTSEILDDQKKERLVTQIVGMGYSDNDVRRALLASAYNAELAIQYINDGIPSPPSAMESDSSLSSSDIDRGSLAFDIFRNDPIFQILRNAVQENPGILTYALQRVGETTPVLARLVNEYQEGFLSVLIEGFDDEDDKGMEDHNE